MSLLSGVKQAMPRPVKSVLRRILGRSGMPVYRVPQHLAANHRTATEAGLLELCQSVETFCRVGWRSKENFCTEKYESDVRDHLLGRLQKDREVIVPWLDSLRPLQGLRILEIGCGTGVSTVALAEQGAAVTGIDVDERAVQVARDRCRVYGIEADLRVMNATVMDRELLHRDFDLILFFACLEHMTVSERLAALSCAWARLPVGGLLGVIETPNRLWLFDQHTSFLPFYHWLPDDLAFQYARFSSRENFHEVYRESTPASQEHFLRRGRGVSFHEFDLAIQPVQTLAVAGSLSVFLEQNGLGTKDAARKTYIQLLRAQCPAVPAPFFEMNLDLVIEKTV